MSTLFSRVVGPAILLLALGYTPEIHAGNPTCNPPAGQGQMCRSPPCSAAMSGPERRFTGVEAMRSGIVRQRERTYSKGNEEAATAAPGAAVTVPDYTTAFAIGGTGDTLIGATAADGEGNLIVTGGFWGTITFPTSPAPASFTSTADSDVFVAKFTPGGLCLWVRIASGASGAPSGLSLDGALAAATDSQNNVYISGGFVGSLSFLNQQGSPLQQLFAGAGGWNIEPFVARYDTFGNLTWARGGMSGGTRHPADLNAGINGVTSLVIDASGNLFAGGTVSGQTFLGASIPAYADGSAFVARLDAANGSPAWVRVFDDVNHGQFGYDGVIGLGSDNAGGVIALGFWEGDAITFPTQPQPSSLKFDVQDDGFLARFNASGQCLWARLPADSGFVYVNALAVTRLGQAYVTGALGGNAVFNGSLVSGPTFLDSQEGFVAKYDGSGSVEWVRTLNTSHVSFGQHISTDAAGNAYFTGWYQGQTSITGNLNDAPGLVIGSEQNAINLYFGLFDAVGTPRWLRALSSPGTTNIGLAKTSAADVGVPSGGLAYNAYSKTIVVAGDFANSLMLGNVFLTAAHASQHSFLAAIPSADGATGPAGVNPAVRGTAGATGWTQSGSFFVSLTLTNTGSTTAYNTTVNALSVRSLNGIPAALVGPAMPACYGDIPIGVSVTRRIYFNTVSGARLSMTATIGLQNQAAAKLTTSAGFAVTAN